MLAILLFHFRSPLSWDVMQLVCLVFLLAINRKLSRISQLCISKIWKISRFVQFLSYVVVVYAKILPFVRRYANIVLLTWGIIVPRCWKFFFAILVWLGTRLHCKIMQLLFRKIRSRSKTRGILQLVCAYTCTFFHLWEIEDRSRFIPSDNRK